MILSRSRSFGIDAEISHVIPTMMAANETLQILTHVETYQVGTNGMSRVMSPNLLEYTLALNHGLQATICGFEKSPSTF